MKLDATDLRYITSDEFRVLTAVEMGSKNHEVVPTVLIVKISGLRNGGVNKLLGSLAKRNLVSRVQNARYDGYRLTYGGYDYLAMRALSKRDSVYSVGNQIGVGKESDIYIVADKEGQEMVLKLHRLGRISFRAIKSKRDYMGKRKSASWMYLSRLSAEKEYAFMKVLYEHDFPVPRPVDQARHCILMEFIDAYPLRQIADIPSPGALYSELMDLIVRFARAGLIHGDFNEFNILIRRETGKPVVIDFPQMVSTSHKNAEWYFNRDVECIRRFFKRRFRYESSIYPRFRSIKSEKSGDGSEEWHLDLVVAASGYNQGEQKVLEEYMDNYLQEQARAGSDEESEGSGEGDEDADEEEFEEASSEEDGEVDEAASDKGQQEADGEAEDVQHEDGDTEAAHQSRERPHESQEPTPTASARGRGGNRGESSADDLHGAASDGDDVSSGADSRRSARSRSPSPSSSLADGAAALSLNSGRAHRKSSSAPKDISEKVQSEVSKQRARQQRKYHSKKGAQRMGGRQRGNKWKQDPKVKVDSGGFWE
ncbi:RIO1-domain-containing protein [Trametes coccinea BRFM310]|uniref:Serine/threonine-protein kinase RIO2 n=1 Tax=Trametes coccinea (strain BRFM310) TaxID=1353009 RepID=A0A1Y2IR51_TRAC3|nr:RIO1-domain-containing protein [Trametes coccinea BRFM310]